MDRTCCSCKRSLSLCRFHKDHTAKMGRSYKCKECKNTYRRGRGYTKADRKYYLKTKQNKLRRAKMLLETFPEKKLIRKVNAQLRYIRNKKVIIEKQIQYKKSKKGKKIISRYEYLKRRSDPCYRIATILRSRLNKLIRDGVKVGSAVKDLGCSIENLKEYLESKFKPGMSWNNYGIKGWHIDHIKPLSSFDLTNRDEFLQACHYTNLQPLWWYENLAKGAK